MAYKLTSSSASLACCVAQGSVSGTLQFLVYPLPLQLILSFLKGFYYHCYTDDVQLYTSFKPQDVLK